MRALLLRAWICSHEGHQDGLLGPWAPQHHVLSPFPHLKAGDVRKTTKKGRIKRYYGIQTHALWSSVLGEGPQYLDREGGKRDMKNGQDRAGKGHRPLRK